MVALREMRMRQAAILLTANTLSIDQIAQGAGYASRSSFLRAFRKVYGSDPSDYRAAARRPAEQRRPVAHEISENL
jgi:AraC-like DNA-binding protein